MTILGTLVLPTTPGSVQPLLQPPSPTPVQQLSMHISYPGAAKHSAGLIPLKAVAKVVALNAYLEAIGIAATPFTLLVLNVTLYRAVHSTATAMPKHNGAWSPDAVFGLCSLLFFVAKRPDQAPHQRILGYDIEHSARIEKLPHMPGTKS
jgi:hypothetical protein